MKVESSKARKGFAFAGVLMQVLCEVFNSALVNVRLFTVKQNPI